MNEPTPTGGLREQRVADDHGVRGTGRARAGSARCSTDCWSRCPTGGAALLLRGDPGIGKTSMLDYVARRARAGDLAVSKPPCGVSRPAPVRVLRAHGVESEAVLPYTVLADLLLPLRPHFADLPSSQRRALETCFALVDADEPNPYAVCAGSLGVLAAAG